MYNYLTHCLSFLGMYKQGERAVDVQFKLVYFLFIKKRRFLLRINTYRYALNVFKGGGGKNLYDNFVCGKYTEKFSCDNLP